VTDPADPTPVPPTVEELQREIEQLRWQLARKTREADIHREAVHDFYRDQLAAYTPMTAEEARELMTAPRGEKSIADLLAELEREAEG
jgi:hypothetical protein